MRRLLVKVLVPAVNGRKWHIPLIQRRIALFVGLLLLIGTNLAAQDLGQKGLKEEGRQTKEDSPHWWTLTDEITPQELRAIHEDIELHKERYREAVEAGTKRLLPREQMELLNYYINGGTHPELFQMRLVFDSFAIGFGIEAADPRASLAEFGFEGEVLETIVLISSEFEGERKILQKKVHEEMKAVSELIRLSKENLGQKNYKIATKARDATMLANATGYSVERVERLLKLWWEETPSADFAAQTLPLLKEALAPSDWDRFRLFLLEVQAPMMSGLGIGYAEGN